MSRQLAQSLKLASPREIIQKALTHHQKLSVAFSGAEDIVVLDLLNQCVKEGKPNRVDVFVLDTGRLHPETYTFLDVVRARYPNLPIACLFPEHTSVEKLVSSQGWHSFRQNGHSECCRIRKVEPLLKKLSMCDGWMTGQRRDQSIETRNQLEVVEEDKSGLLKWNPLTFWSQKMVWTYILEQELPFNELHKKGFQSIGCAPCTIPTLPGQHERAGRWHWETESKKECGLHARKKP